jgi:hypothetical protein
LNSTGRRFLLGGIGSDFFQRFDASEIALSVSDRSEQRLRLRAYLRAQAALGERVQNLARQVELLTSQMNLGQQQQKFLSSWRERDGFLQQFD